MAGLRRGLDVCCLLLYRPGLQFLLAAGFVPLG